LAPDAIEVSDRFSLRSLAGWGARQGVTTVMISHERLDRLTGQIMPRPLARRIADMANRRTAANYDTVLCTTSFAREEFDRIGATNVMTVPLGVSADVALAPRRHETFTWPRAAAGCWRL
jgi:alpha-1,6-mannosyltransferase